MMPPAAADFGAMLEQVALRLLGDPTKGLSKPGIELRFGRNGSVSVDLRKNTWFDHENQVGGGTLDLVKSRLAISNGAAIEWLRAEGFDVPERQQHEKPSRAQRTIEAEYRYTDADGRLQYKVVRYFPKDFRQCRPSPDGDGSWIWALDSGEFMRKGRGDWIRYDAKRFTEWKYTEHKTFGGGVEHGLYRRAEIKEAIADGAVVFLLEGEKDCETAAELGAAATTNSGGAKHWSARHAEMLRGADVVIVPDNDKTGRQGAALKAASLAGVAKRVRILDLAQHWPGCPPKGDISDWRAATGGSASDLFALVAKAEPWRPAPPESRFGALRWCDLDAPSPEHEWMIKGLLTRGERSLLVGPSGSGKSFVATDIALAVARGVPYRGRKTRQGLVIYQAGEGGRGLKKRLRAYRKHYQMEPGEDLPFVLLTSPVDLYANDDHVDALIGEIKQWAANYPVPLELVVIDTLSAATPGANENASEDMTKVLARLAKLAEACDCHVMLVHHLNAAGSKPRGHSSLFANIENAIEVVKAGPVDVDLGNGTTVKRTLRRATITKQKDGEDGATWDFLLRPVEIGTDEDGDKITSCVVVDAEDAGVVPESPARASGALSPSEAAVYRAIVTALDEAGVPPPAGLRLPQSIRTVVDYERVKVVLRDSTPSDEEPTEDGNKRHREKLKKMLGRGRDGLVKGGYIGVHNPHVWLTGKLPPGSARPTLPPAQSEDPREQFMGAGPNDSPDDLF